MNCGSDPRILKGEGYNEQMDQSLSARLKTYLARPIWQQLKALCQLADRQQIQLYLVGGLVRDCLMNQPSADLDVVVVGDAPTFAQTVKQQFNGRLQIHEQFRTATWFPDKNSYYIDFITARSETYPYPGSLPVITPSTSIVDDLRRRDFPVNAMAIRLDGAHFGQLVDHLNGLDDLQAGIIRVLHEQSFQDDATRMWRAVRYEQRLRFMLEPQTAAWLKRDLPYLQTISGDRIRHELVLILMEPTRHYSLARLDELGILSYIAEELHWQPQAAVWFARLPREAEWPLFLALWLLTQTAEVRLAALDYLNFSKDVAQLVVQTAALVAKIQATQWGPPTRPSVIEKALRPFAKDDDLLTAVQAALPPDSTAVQLLQRYVQTWRYVQTAVDGYTLQHHGLLPGPIYRTILDQILAAKLDGDVTTAEEEQWLLRQILSKLSG